MSEKGQEMIRLKLEGKFTVVFFKEKDERNIVAYCPVLDLSTCGNTIEKAKRNFIQCLKIYLEETIKHGTLESDLLKLGWKPDVMNLTMVPPPQNRYRNIPLRILRKEEMRIKKFQNLFKLSFPLSPNKNNANLTGLFYAGDVI